MPGFSSGKVRGARTGQGDKGLSCEQGRYV